MVIILLQASIYISVDMLPLPGAQGIIEAMYQKIFADIFRGSYLVTSMCIIRGIGFYLIMLLSAIVWSKIYFTESSK